MVLCLFTLTLISLFRIYLFIIFTAKMLISYRRQIGNVTSIKVITSVVGVIMAATIRIITIACRRYSFMKSAVRMPILPSNIHNIGNSNTIPSISVSIVNVSIYELSVMIFDTSSLTWQFPKNRMVRGNIRKQHNATPIINMIYPATINTLAYLRSFSYNAGETKAKMEQSMYGLTQMIPIIMLTCMCMENWDVSWVLIRFRLKLAISPN